MRPTLDQRLTSVLSRIFDKAGRLLASKKGLDYRDFLVSQLLRDDVSVASSSLGVSLLVRQICESVIQKGIDRTGGYTGTLGTDNELNRACWVERTIKSLPPGGRLLDAGAGEQQYRKHCAHLRYVSQDFAQYDGAGNSTGLHTGTWNYGNIDIISDICNIPEPDASFDAVLCTEVFEHIADPIGAIKEFARLLRPEGTLILTAPFASLTHFAPHFYYTGFSRFFYSNILAENGFKEVSISESGGYFDYLAQELHRLPSIADRYATEALAVDLKKSAWLLQESLADCAAHDTGSKELLCYGLHVIARRS